jgi:hypothetical protein
MGARAHDTFSALALRLHSQLGAGGKSILLSDESNTVLAQSLRACALDEATYGLQRHEPQFSAAQVVTRGQRNFFLTALLLLAATLVIFPATGGLLLTGVVACGYLANAVFRGLLFWVGADEVPTHEMRTSDSGPLPIYTVLVPLYHEANIISQLTASLRRLDYPAANLDCKLVVEEDDRETCDAARVRPRTASLKLSQFREANRAPSHAPATMHCSSLAANFSSSTTQKISRSRIS